MKHKYKVISIDDYAVVIEDKRIENPTSNDTILDEYNKIGKFVDLSHLGLGYGNLRKVIATIDKDMRAEGITLLVLPNQEEDVEKLAIDRAWAYLQALGYFTNPTSEGKIIEDLLLRAKAAQQDKKWSDEDIEAAYNRGFTSCEDHEEQSSLEYLQSLQKKTYPEYVELEMEQLCHQTGKPCGYPCNGEDNCLKSLYIKITDKENNIIYL